MESLNRIELRGRVGRIKREKVMDDEVARISLYVETALKSFSGANIVDRDWFNIVAWKGEKVNFDAVTDNSVIYVVGRVRMRHYTGADGRDRCTPEVVASELKWEGR